MQALLVIIMLDHSRVLTVVQTHLVLLPQPLTIALDTLLQATHQEHKVVLRSIDLSTK
jgi:hypothetical protein